MGAFEGAADPRNAEREIERERERHQKCFCSCPNLPDEQFGSQAFGKQPPTQPKCAITFQPSGGLRSFTVLGTSHPAYNVHRFFKGRECTSFPLKHNVFHLCKSCRPMFGIILCFLLCSAIMSFLFSSCHTHVDGT